MNFFVIGLPRSRTAWLANFLTYDRFCYHEGFNECRTMDEYKEKLGPDKGDSSTGLMVFDMNKEFPGAPIVIIESDGEKAKRFIEKEFGEPVPEGIDFLKEKMSMIKGLRIHVNDIDDRLEEIWEYLIGTPFDYDRAELLKSFNVQMKDTQSVTKWIT